MVVLFEFLSDEPIENVITCMNFKIDKVVFFGYYSVICALKKQTETFLKAHCGVQTVVFHSLSQKNLQSTLTTMRKEILNERSPQNQVYFDITGGEDLILVAFGMLSKEYETPMHIYDIAADKLIDLDEGAKASISKDVEARKIPVTLELLVKMHGGIINHSLHKEIKDIGDSEFMADVDRIYQVAKQNWEYWNPFSHFLQTVMAPVNPETLQVSKSARTVLDALSESVTKLKTVRKLNEIIDSLAASGILLDVYHREGQFGLRYKNQAVRDCLWEGGSILELHICQIEAKGSNECQTGVHIDWDGVIHEQSGEDVLNEIDVLALNGNIPTFISCKSGKMGAHQILHALYELDTIAKRFGGKYARKVLVTVSKIPDVYLKRAEEMGIEIR